MTTVFTVVGVKALIYKTLEEEYGITPTSGPNAGGSGGLTQAQVQAIVDQAIANLPAGGSGGVTEAQVEAAVSAAAAPILARVDSLKSELDSGLVNANATLAGVFNQLQEMVAVTESGLEDRKADKADLSSLMDELVGPTDRPGTPTKVGGFTNWVRNELKDNSESIFNLKNDKAEKSDLTELDNRVVALEVTGGSGGEAPDLTGLLERLTAVETDSQASTTNIQQIFDVFAQQEGGSIRQLQDFYDGLTQWVGGAIVQLQQVRDEVALFDSGDGSGVAGFLALLNDIVGQLLDATGVTPPSGKLLPVDSGDNRIAALEAEVERMSAAGGVLPSGECATKVDLSQYVKKSELGALQPVPVPDNVKIPYPVVGEGVSLITPSNVMNVRYMHTPGPDDNFLLVFVSYMIPSVVPGGSVWNIKVTYGGKQATFFQEYNSASVAADRTRGTVQGYWLSITPDPTQTPQEVVITCTTGMDLTGKAGDPTYAFRSNSVTMSNRTTSSHVGSDGSGAASINVAGAAGFNRRHIGFVHVPTTPSRTFINTVNGPAHVLWEVDDNGGRRVMIYTTTDEHQIVHGGQAANAYASGFITVNALAPPKVT